MKIAVVAILIFNEKVLLLHRTHTPLCWGPPGGELNENESFTAGIKREVFEETGLECTVVMPIDTWQGLHDNTPIQSITFICECNTSRVTLSKEHDAFCWVPINDLSDWKNLTDFDITLWKNYIQIANFKKLIAEEYCI